MSGATDRVRKYAGRLRPSRASRAGLLSAVTVAAAVAVAVVPMPGITVTDPLTVGKVGPPLQITAPAGMAALADAAPG